MAGEPAPVSSGDAGRVAVCVLTHQRPEGLRRLLSALGDLEFRGRSPEVEIVVIDNDAKCSAEALCAKAAETQWCAVRYRVEPRRGIATARNTALREALPDKDFIVFIDDDEIPQPQWLDELLSTQRAYRADVVAGPVLPHFVEPPPSWVVKGRFFERRRHPVGQQVNYAFTGNVLVRAAVFRETGMQFDERLGLVGGEDRHLFQRVAEAGYRIVWADRALVHEWIPANRPTVRWVLRRSFRAGNSMAFTQLDLRPALSTAATLLGKGIAWKIIGAGVLVSGLVRGAHAMVGGARYLAYGAGLITGLGGMRYREYRITDGD